MLNLGNVQSGSTTPLYFPFVTSNKTGSAASFSDALETNDFRIYKDGGITERASQNGYVITSAFDGLAGAYMFSVDISDNTTAGFYQSGSQFHILLSPDTETVDGETVRQWIGTFTIIGDPAQSRISGSILATSASVATVDTVVDGIQTDLDNGTDGLGAIKTDTAAVKVVTDQMVFTVANQVDANAVAISGDSVAADNWEEFASSIITGTAGATSLTTTTCSSDLTAYADDELIGRTIIFTSGTAAGQAGRVTDYANTSGVVTFTTLATAPLQNDTFVIV